ncbi:G-protein coupled receptor 143-like [Dendronephthya gigantea]|uniref:G-protein coupled receptor 143-like n=1 Tax=Dendronephthya gigantea TaxID=151771 RepID=UPI00106B71BE|nr:G-protein coupled receptor 143-like [Dendronephthya gigantea]
MAFLRDRSIFCIPNTTLDHNERLTISGICIPTSIVGFTGAALQLKYLWQYRDRQRRRPSADPRIIFYLALSDLLTCLGLLSLGVLLIVLEEPVKNSKGYRPKSEHVIVYESIGTSVEVVALFGFLASVVWTFSFALDMSFQLYGINCPMVVYHILSWCIPIDIIVVVQSISYGIWKTECEGILGRRSRLIVSYLPVMVVIVVNPILFIITYQKVKKLLRCTGSFTVEDRQVLHACKWKLFWMVATFTICWFPNVISATYDLFTVGFSNEDKMTKIDVLWYLEALLNPLQGIMNYFVYRHSFRVSPNDSTLSPRRLPRVAHVNSALESCLSTSSVQQENSLLHSGTTINQTKPHTKSKHNYVARLLGEYNVKKEQF